MAVELLCLMRSGRLTMREIRTPTRSDLEQDTARTIAVPAAARDSSKKRSGVGRMFARER